MATKNLTVYANAAGQVEISDMNYQKARELLEQFFSLLTTFDQANEKALRNFDSRLKEMEDRHTKALNVAQSKIDSLQSDLQQANSELRAAVAASQYRKAPELEGVITEINQQITAATTEKSRLEASLNSERVMFLDDVEKAGPGVLYEGLQWWDLRNTAAAALLEWSNRMSRDVHSTVSLLARDARQTQHWLRLEVAKNEKALADFKAAAAARYNGSGVKTAAVQGTPQSAPPATGRGGIPDWGETPVGGRGLLSSWE